MKSYRIAACSALLLMLASLACATPPLRFNYQARLTDSSGTPLVGDHSMTFVVYQGGDAFTESGIAVYSETATVTAESGIVNHSVGGGVPDGGPLTAAAFDYEGDMYLGVAVDTPDNFILPKIRLQSVPFALQATNSKQLNGLTEDDFATSNALSNYLPYNSSAYVVVKTTDDIEQNGDNLLAAYAAAKLLNPNGFARSQYNRVAVLVPPGSYELGSDILTLDTDYIDLVGISSVREDQAIFGTANGINTGLIMQSANDVHIENIFVSCTRIEGTLSHDSTDPAAYFPLNSGSLTVIRNCQFISTSAAFSMRVQWQYDGTYKDVRSGLYSFGYNGSATGSFVNCEALDYSFATAGVASGYFKDCLNKGRQGFGGNLGFASGTFINCSGGDYAFGEFGGATGTFFNCTGGVESFGTDGYCSGTFTHCTGGDYAFGGCHYISSYATGKFVDCVGGNFSFGGISGFVSSHLAGGTFQNCTGGDTSFGVGPISNADASGAKFLYCIAGPDSFTASGDPAPVALYCVRDGAAYP